MKRLQVVAAGLLVASIGFGGNCSRARVESMNMMNEGVLYAQSKRYIEAVEKLERATALDATNDQAYYNLALVHMETSAY
jgi:tetratricopeptide (TPR) repeat protein